MSSPFPLAWIILGVSGSGKTTIGRLLSSALECDFLEGDRRHSRANIAKMSKGIPLNDADRRQWLGELRRDITRAVKNGREMVLTCSGLKVAYRNGLARPGRVRFIYVHVPEAVLRQRLSKRKDHYFKASMLKSQLAAFEPIQPNEPAFTADGTATPEEIVQSILTDAKQRWPLMRETWWRRYLEEEK